MKISPFCILGIMVGLAAAAAGAAGYIVIKRRSRCDYVCAAA